MKGKVDKATPTQSDGMSMTMMVVHIPMEDKPFRSFLDSKNSSVLHQLPKLAGATVHLTDPSKLSKEESFQSHCDDQAVD